MTLKYLARRLREQPEPQEVHVFKFMFDLFRQTLHGSRCSLSYLKVKLVSPVEHLTPEPQTLDLPGIHFGNDFRVRLFRRCCQRREVRWWRTIGFRTRLVLPPLLERADIPVQERPHFAEGALSATIVNGRRRGAVHKADCNATC